jgi:hypothetical protein
MLIGELSDTFEPNLGRVREWDAGDRRLCLGLGVVCAGIIGILDESTLSVVEWMVVILLLGYHGMPAIFWMAGRLHEKHPSMFLGVALGWALIPGPPVGMLFGTLSPVIFGLPISSQAGGLLGLVVGPIVAALEGLTIFLVFAVHCRVVCFVFGVTWRVVMR